MEHAWRSKVRGKYESLKDNQTTDIQLKYINIEKKIE